MHRKEYDPVKLGKNLKQCRLRNHLTIEDVRKYMHLGSKQAVYKWESGASIPPGDSMLALMELYHATVKDFVEGPVVVKADYDLYPASYARLQAYYTRLMAC